MSGAALDAAALAAWVGRSESRTDLVSERETCLLAATLDLPAAPAPGEPQPPLWHWTTFAPMVRASETGADGHPHRGGFMPPVPLPRRMWAGGRLSFHAPLRVGEPATRHSRIADLKLKEGKTGTLVFVTVRHEISGPAGLAISEEQDVVYRAAAVPGDTPPAPPPAPTGAQWSDTVHPDPVLLFRYSALTFNGHRIHYDLAYAREDEGYPGLLVHGPLIATLLAGALARRSTRPLKRFAFRGLSPLFHDAPFTLNGTIEGAQARLWAANPDGGLAMSAEAELG
jgi:3-methylfumaryl-CoA hydratase